MSVAAVVRIVIPRLGALVLLLKCPAISGCNFDALSKMVPEELADGGKSGGAGCDFRPAPDLCIDASSAVPIRFQLEPLTHAEWSTSTLAADVDSDGRLDLILHDRTSLPVRFILGEGGDPPRFRPVPETLDVGRSSELAVGDFNGDGRPDLITRDAIEDEFRVFPNRGSVRFGPPVATRIAGMEPPVIVCDLDADGRLDVVTGMNESSWELFRVLRGRGDGTFDVAVGTEGFGNSGRPLLATDFDGDRRLEIAVGFRHHVTGRDTVRIFRGTDGFRLPTAEFSHPVAQVRHLVAGDFDRDGHEDLATFRSNGKDFERDIHIAFGDGAALFPREQVLESNLGASYGFAADFDGDSADDILLRGTADWAWQNPIWDDVIILRGSRSGVLRASPTACSSEHGFPVLVTDLDRDGAPDIVLNAPIPVTPPFVPMNKRILWGRRGTGVVMDGRCHGL